jgi:hypothetical protein
MKHIKLFEDFKSLAEISQKWYDKPSKISKEILEIVDGAFPKRLLDAATHIEPNSYDTMISPPTVSNKGQSNGTILYKTINFYFKEPYGKDKIKNIQVGLRKGTSGRDTGYIAVELMMEKKKVEHAVEFSWEPIEALKKLYIKEIEQYTDEIGHIGRQYGV